MDLYSIKRTSKIFEIIDQTCLPHHEVYTLIYNYREMIEAIKNLRIRGAPALGIAAVAGCYLASELYKERPDYEKKMMQAVFEIENSRPTAVNLFYATRKVREILKTDSLQWNRKLDSLVDELMYDELRACEMIAQYGYEFIPPQICSFLTHCNTGSLATYGSGTALGVLKKIATQREIEVYVDETRPLLQGSRLTMWELMKEKIPCTLITDNMAARTIQTKDIQAIITGADRIARNGDTANKIGTYNLAILAKYFHIPFYVVAPESTFDNSIKTGKEMIIEIREADEILQVRGARIAPETAKVFNPAFDITPKELITAIITDKGIRNID